MKVTLQRATTPRGRIIFALAATLIAVLALVINGNSDVDPAGASVTTDTRMPIRKPLLEPDRPDLLQEP